jgi:outer membrane receptor protein involved in Fe transport
VFKTRYDGIQLNFQQGTSPTIRNAGDAEIKGVEFEAVAAPIEGLTLNASVGYLHARYTDVLAGVLAVSGPNPFQAGTFVGAPLPKTPTWKINFSPRYEFKLANGGSITAIGDWTYTSSIWNNAQRTYLLKRPAVQVVNASLAYADPGGAWSVSVGGTNLTDKRYLTTGNENIAAGAIFGTYSRPREAYVRLGVTF